MLKNKLSSSFLQYSKGKEGESDENRPDPPSQHKAKNDSYFRQEAAHPFPKLVGNVVALGYQVFAVTDPHGT